MEAVKEHIVMLPFMAQGHLIPFLAVANKIHPRFGFTITIATTAVNVDCLRRAVANYPNHRIHLFELEFNSSDHGLPPNTENTEALPLDQIVSLFHSSKSLEPPFRALIRNLSEREGRAPLYVISDVFIGWADEVARSCGIVNVSFSWVEKCLRWLDSRPQKLVMYISFGSQNTINPRQMMALGMGLEDSKKALVWVIRPPVGFALRGNFKSEWLPHEFEKRMTENNQRLVVHGWAPQLEILCHESTGAFMSHCGWNSVMESLSQGVPIIGWPLKRND